MTVGPFTVYHHTETTSDYCYIVFVTRTMERAKHLGENGGFKTWKEAYDAALNQSRFGTQNV